MRRFELVDFDRPLRKPGQNFKLTTQSLDDFLQSGYLHVALFLKFGEAWLFHAEFIGYFPLAHAGQLPNLAEQQLPEQFL